jgi:GntR family transcriptional regulator
MLIRVEKGSSVPISRQLAEQIRAQCLSGTLQPGERLPSVRDLARELAVNVNTVFRVYERLEADQLIEMRHGDGTFVRPRPAPAAAARQLETQREQYAAEFDALIRRGLLLGLGAGDLRRHLDRALKGAGASVKQYRNSSEGKS